MPAPNKRAPERQVPTSENFNTGCALSESVQPNLSRLFLALIDPDVPVTFFVGAGASADAGYPTWAGLLQALSEKISSPRLAELARNDTDGPLRQAETLFRLIAPTSAQSDSEILREVLYKGRNAANSGQLAKHIVSIARVLNGRASFITTNFDDVLETALEEAGLDPESFSLRNESRDAEEDEVGIDVMTFPGVQDWLAARQSGKHAVMHLHGMLRRGLDPLRPLILTESHFLRYGQSVRQLLLEELRNRVVIFIGVSLSDPDVVGPLWDLQQFKSAGSPRDRFVVHVPGMASGAKTIEESREYAFAKYEYLELALGVSPIFLKSWSQLHQLLIELGLIASTGNAYFDSTGTNPLEYGPRFRRALRQAYEAVGTAPNQPPTAAEATKLRVAHHLQDLVAPAGELGMLLRNPDQATRVRHRALKAKYQGSRDEEMVEKFGLSIWLRALAEAGEPHAPYALNLVASSAHVVLGTPTAGQGIAVSRTSRHPAARAIYTNMAMIGNTPASSSGQQWHGCIAIPLTVSPSRGVRADDVLVGAVSINTTALAMPSESAKGVVSILAACRQDDYTNNLIRTLKTCASQVLTNISRPGDASIARALSAEQQGGSPTSTT